MVVIVVIIIPHSSIPYYPKVSQRGLRILGQVGLRGLLVRDGLGVPVKGIYKGTFKGIL